ncbi:MAG: hypothetical protein ACRD0Z_04925, partial [Acidimicrobiales bacterium]
RKYVEDLPRPEATGPEATGPEATRPEATGPEATGPEATRPEATGPEATRPEATRPEATRPEGTGAAPTVTLTALNDGAYPMGNGLSRIECRFWGRGDELAAARAHLGKSLLASECHDLGLVTQALDELDWDDEIRLVLEERAAFSPDALTGMEANLRFPGPETIESKIFGRLSAWQNWIFLRPNASGPDGALRRYGTGSRPSFTRKRV